MVRLRPSKKALRNLAADCYVRANRNASEAAELLKAELDGKRSVPRPERFCRRWGERRLASGGVEDAPRSGRPNKLTEDWVDRCITALSHGFEMPTSTGTKTVPYRTWSQFCQNDPTALECLEETGVTPAHLLRTCVATVPTLKRVKIQVKVWLKPEIKSQRVAAAAKLLDLPPAWFESVVWLDCKTMYINPTNYYAWVDTATMSPHDLVKEDKRCRARGKELVKLKFYIAVNAKCGPVALVWVTGTSGLAYDRFPPPRGPYLTKKGRPAKGCTAREFCDVMRSIHEAASTRVTPLLVGSEQQQLVWSFDNDRVHQAALPQLREEGLLTNTNIAPLPPFSPDMHKVVEHCIARLTGMVAAALADTEDVHQDVAYWMGRLEAMFFGGVTADSIARDVGSLAETYMAILEVEGGYPAKRYR